MSVHTEEDEVFQEYKPGTGDAAPIQSESCRRTAGKLSLIFLSADFISISQTAQNACTY